MREYTINDIIEKITGEEDNLPKAAVTMNVVLIDQDGAVVDAGNYSTYKPIVDIVRLGNYVQVDLKFKSTLDNDLNVFWRIIEDYAYKLNHMDEYDGKEPGLSLTFVPSDLDCEYFINVNSPIFWSLQPEKPNEPNNILRMCFELNNFLVYEMTIPREELLEEVNREIVEENNYYERYNNDAYTEEDFGNGLYNVEDGKYMKK